MQRKSFVFGYVTVAKNQLTQEEYNTFLAYYCGVCRETGRAASQTARLGLSYDITFLALVLSSLYTPEETLKNGRCIPHPIKSRSFIASDPAVSYASAMGVLLEYLKLADDWHDERKLKALLGMAALYRGCKKVKKRYKEQSGYIKEQLDILSGLERDNCASVDEAADAFAKITERIFAPDFIEDKPQRRALAWLGYNLGRWIYVLDAYNDMEDDLKNGAYNPLLAAGFRNKEQCAKKQELSLTITLSNIASAFELIDFKRNRALIGKIVYISLKDKQKGILFGVENNKKKVD